MALGHVQSLSAAGSDYVTHGFYAANRAEELTAPNLEVTVLVSMNAVTDQVQAAAEGLSEADGLRAREAEIARLEKQSLDQTGLLSDVVSLYNGSEY